VELSDTPVEAPVVEDVKRKRKKSSIALEEEEINSSSASGNGKLVAQEASSVKEVITPAAPVVKGKRVLAPKVMKTNVTTATSSNTNGITPSVERKVTIPMMKKEIAREPILKVVAQRQLVLCNALSAIPKDSSVSGEENGGGLVIPSYLTLPPALEVIMDFWTRSLYLLHHRLAEASSWKSSAMELLGVGSIDATGTVITSTTTTGVKQTYKGLL
jgi:hypothetical protein